MSGQVDYMVVNETDGVIWYAENIGTTHNPDDTGPGGYGTAVRLADLDGQSSTLA